MKTRRSIVPVMIVVTLLTGAAVVISMVVRGGQEQIGEQEAPLVDTGPNAGLSNSELVSVAITNMKALKSYHFDFKGGAPSMDTRMSSNLRITADVQLHGQGARWKVRDEGGGVFGGTGMNFDVGTGIDGIRQTNGHWYESYDGGKTWDPPTSGDSQLSFLLLWLDCRWGNLFEEGPVTDDPTICESAARHVDFNDGTPRLEKIDGGVTRHMIGVYGDEQAKASGQALTVELWATTDTTPTLRQMYIKGSNKLYENVVEGANQIALSPGGSTLAAAHGWAIDGTIRLYDIDSPGAPQRKLTVGMRTFDSVDISSEGSLLAATSGVPASRVEGVYIWDLTKPKSKPITRAFASDVYFLAFQPGGRTLAAASRQGIYLFDPLNAKAPPTVLPIPEGYGPQGLAFSGDGTTLAVEAYVDGDSSGDRLVYDMRDPGKAPVHIRSADSGDHIAISPDGQLLASAASSFGSGKGQISVWDLSKPQAPPVTLAGKAGNNPAAVFSPDGKYLVILGEDRQVEFWDVDLLTGPAAANSPAIKLDSGEELTTDLAFSPDGGRLAVATDDGSVLVWKTADVLKGEAAKPRIFKEEMVLIDKPFTLSWKWSHLNGDFGFIDLPPGSIIKQP